MKPENRKLNKQTKTVIQPSKVSAEPMKSEPIPKKEIVKNTVDNKSPRKITEVNDNFELDIVD